MPHREGGHLISCTCRMVCAGTQRRQPCSDANDLRSDRLFELPQMSPCGWTRVLRPARTRPGAAMVLV